MAGATISAPLAYSLARHPMRSVDLRRLRASRPHLETARRGTSALVRARGTARRTARALVSPMEAPTAGLLSLSGLSVQPAPSRREARPRG